MTKPRILFVDDEPGVLRSMKWLFRNDYEVAVANSGQEAIEMIARQDFDVVVSDQRMPEITGVEVLREVKRISPRSMRVLLTGYSDLEAIIGSINEGEVFRFINKPWDNDELRQVVKLAADAADSPVLVEPEAESEDEEPTLGPDQPNLLLIDDQQQTFEFLRDVIGKSFNINQAPDLDRALDLLEKKDIGVIVSDTHIGAVDATRLIKELKRLHPEIVTIVFTEHNDADTVIDLINHGQVFRFLPKPIKPGLFKLSVKSAMRRHLELMSNPDIAVRHKVEPVHDTPAANDDGPRKVAVEVEDLNQEERPSFLGRLFSIFRNKKNRKSLS